MAREENRGSRTRSEFLGMSFEGLCVAAVAALRLLR